MKEQCSDNLKQTRSTSVKADDRLSFNHQCLPQLATAKRILVWLYGNGFLSVVHLFEVITDGFHWSVLW